MMMVIRRFAWYDMFGQQAKATDVDVIYYAIKARVQQIKTSGVKRTMDDQSDRVHPKRQRSAFTDLLALPA